MAQIPRQQENRHCRCLYLHYELHVSKDDPKDFMFHETWQTVEDWNAHMAAPHLISLVGILDRYTENGITVIKTKPID